MFQTELGISLPDIESLSYLQLLDKLKNQIGIKQLQIEEAASFSMAMVLRVALGLDAKDAKLAVLVNESLSGAIALATARQLQNAGCEIKIIFVGKTNLDSEILKEQLTFHDYNQTECFIWDSIDQNTDFNHLIADQHAVLVGLFQMEDVIPSDFQNKLTELLNESNVPCHTIFAPLGFDWKTGTKNGTRLIASSTLSVGIPLSILTDLKDFIGRHYLCDVSIPNKLSNELGIQLPLLFSEQPVIQVFAI
jgi:NAD(P)H-hydrate repair Nnr-like enzyme with NAD(P)H-hydrate epimerase domain